MIRGGKREICAGAIAVYYEQKGGRVRSHGKPDRQIYDACLEALGNIERRRVATIGDSLRTDIAGAIGAGLDGIFVADGIHGEALGLGAGGALAPESLAALFEERGIWPTASLPRLRW